jgi:TRAP-type C4-dicarboxylate transport system substrate-binding protein
VSPGAWAAALVSLLIAVLAGCGGSGGSDEGQRSSGQARYQDPVSDGGQLPDIGRIEVTSAPTGMLTFRVRLEQFTARTETVVDLWLDTDADPETGNTTFEGADGTEYLVSAFLGPGLHPPPGCGEFKGGCLARYSPNGWIGATAPTARVSRTAHGFTVSIDRHDLDDTHEFNFFAVRGAEAPGHPDRAPGRGTYNYSLALHGPRPDTSRKVRDGADKAGGDDERKPVVLTVGNHDYLKTDPIASAFVSAVNRLSDGSLKLDVREGWRFYDIDSERGTIGDVAHRDIDLALVGARAFDRVGVTSFRALLAPFLIDSFAYEQRVLESPVVDRMLDAVEPRGLVGLGILPGGLRRPLGISRPLVRPADYVNAAMAVRPGGVAAATFRALGGSASGFRSEQLPMYDGSELDVTTILNNRYDAHARALTTNVVLWPRATTIVINRKAYDALTSDQQQLLRDAGRAAVAPAIETLRSEERDSLTSLCETGHLRLVNASPADRAALRRAVQPVYDKLERDALTRELLGEIEKLGDGVPASELRCPKAHDKSSRTPVDGRWGVDVSPAALAAAGASKQEIGMFKGPITLDLRGGRWVARIGESGNVFRGTYRLDDDVLRLTLDSCTPTNVCMAGEVTEYRWSVYRDKLSLSRSRRYVFPALVAEPWTRIR